MWYLKNIDYDAWLDWLGSNPSSATYYECLGTSLTLSGPQLYETNDCLTSEGC